MPVLPYGDRNLLEFCEAHVPIWEGSPAGIGLSQAAVNQLKAETVLLRAAYDEAIMAREGSKAATTALKTRATPTRQTAADLIRQIKAFAAMQADPGLIYSAAQIPEPAQPSPAQAPGTPNNVTVTLEPSGAVTLAWDASNSAASTGAFFSVMRKLPGQTAFFNVGGSPGATTVSRRMKFTDFTVPTSAAGSGAQYIIQGYRGDRTGQPSEAITVQFGVEGSGGTGGSFAVGGGGAGVTSPMKIAA